MIRKIAINRCFGGFSLSPSALDLYATLSGKCRANLGPYDFCPSARRDDPHLILVIERLGAKAASGRYADLAIVEIPSSVKWEISDYDGMEVVAEKHRIWS